MQLKSWTWIFIPFLLAAMRATGFAQVATTQIVDTIYHADGTTATGTALIAWPAFTSSMGDAIPAGTTSAVIGTGGALSISLIPNSGAIPVGTYYTVTYHLDDNSITRQYWVVPQSSTPLRVAAIESTVMPTSVAIQTATKAYVDTAIAAATTGHPLDSSPLVLKAGDTMTGPLMLPADPVSSMQAATKHYVDSTITSLSANFGSLTGQTAGNLPLATSATASSTSSHFFENTSTAGIVNQGFLSQKRASNCRNRGVTFTQYACDEFDFYDDGSAPGNSPRNLTGLNIHGQFWGPGGYAGAEGRTSTLFGNSNNGAFVTPGIKLTQVSNMNHFGIGDSQGFQISEAMHAGVAYQSDQGSQLIYAWVGEQGHWNGTVAAGGTATSPQVTFTGGCLAQQNQACVPSPGWVMLDKSVTRGSGKITGACSTSSIPWLGSCPTDQTGIPVASAWGTALNVNLSPATTWDAPVAQTFTIGANGGSGSGAFAAGDHACVIGNSFFEQRIVTSVSGTAGAQTITIPLSQPEGSVAIFKGDCMHLVDDANASHGLEFALPTVSLDGSRILTGFPGFSTISPWTGVAAGSGWTSYDGGPNSGFHLYAGARIDRIDTTSPDYAPFAAQFMVITLEPNSAFNVGDVLSSPDFPLQKVDGMELTAVQDVPSNSAGQLTGMRLHIGGHGANGAAALMRFYNDETIGSYTPWGGPLSEPAMLTQEGAGAFGTLFAGNYTPLSTGFYFSNHQPGQTSYDIWHDPNWGVLTLRNDSSLSYDGTNGIRVKAVHSAFGADFGGSVTIGSNTAANISLDLRGDGGPANIAARFASGYQGAAAGSLIGGQVLGIVNSGQNSETDRAYDRLRDDGNGHQGHEWGLFHNDNSPLTGMYLAPDESGNGLSIMNGHANCAHLICLGPNVAVDSTAALFGGSIGTSTTAPTVFGATGTQTVTVQGRNPANNRAAFAFEGSMGGSLHGMFEFGTDLSQNGARDFYIYDYANASVPFYIHPDDSVDFSSSVKASTVVGDVYKGPATAPTGPCSTTGWAFSQDGHISFCNGSTWIQKM